MFHVFGTVYMQRDPNGPSLDFRLNFRFYIRLSENYSLLGILFSKNQLELRLNARAIEKTNKILSSVCSACVL